MNVLIVKLSAIGDVVLSLPFLSALRKAKPEARLTWLVEEAASDLVVDHPLLDRVIVSRRKSWTRDLKAGRPDSALAGVRSFLKELQEEKYDLAVDLQGLFKSGILIFLSRAGRRVGFDRTREYSYLFLNERLPAYDPDKHALLRYLDAAVYLGADAGAEVDFSFPVHPAAQTKAAELLEPVDRTLVAVNPGAKWITKLWPEEHWRELVGLLTGPGGLGVVMTGGPDERETNESIVRGLEGVLDLTGRTDLKTLAEIYRRVGFLICPDTGPMHLAAAAGATVAAIFGPTAPWRTGPFGDHHLVIRTGTDCSPCFKKKCDRPHCMTDIKAAQVFEAVMGRLEKV